MKSRLLSIAFLIIALLTVAGVATAQTASFTASPTTGCAPMVVNFTNTSTGTGLIYFWDFGNGITSTLQHPSTIYLTAGTYTVKLRIKDAAGHKDSVQYVNLIEASPAPVANFYSPDTTGPPCGAKTVTFLNTTVLNAPGGGSYEWDFGEGLTYTTTSAGPLNHSYTSCGNYTVTMVATNSAGCAASVSQSQYIKVLCNPIASFTATNPTGCTTPHTVGFDASATAGAVSYYWNFGDGSAPVTSSSPTTAHTYLANGTYNVTLIATSAQGCTDTLTQTGLVVINHTTAGFSPVVSTVCQGVPLSFSNSSTPAGGVSTWYFNYPSGAPADMATASSPVYAYNTAGTYTVKLVYTANGCADTATGSVTVLPKPATAFTGTPLYACSAPLTVSFSAAAGAAAYSWQFGDGGSSSLANPSHTYLAPGSYHVTLITTSTAGCKDTLLKPAYVQIGPPSASIVGPVNLGCAPANGDFSLSVGSPAGISGFSYSWNWGDGTPATVTSGYTASHVYSTAGTYVITVTGTGSGPTAGCSFTTTKTVVVGATPDASFTAAPNPVCFGNDVYFTNTSTGATTYQWFFGDGGTSSAVNPAWNFSDPGTFTVMLVASSGGCSDTTYQTVVILEPRADFTYSLQNCNDRYTVCFNNISVSSGPTLYAWDFGVPGTTTDTSSAYNPCFTFPAYGSYPVQLTVTNLTTGCTDIITRTVNIFNLKAKLLSADSNLCAGQTASFTAQSNPFYNQYSWNWGDGSAWEAGTTATMTHTYSLPGLYTVRLVVRDVYNCTDTLTKTNFVNVAGIVPGFTATPVSGCVPMSVSFTDTATALFTTITNHIWYFGETPGASTSTGAATTATHTYLTPLGSFGVKLVYIMANGCKDSITRPALITTGGATASFTISPDTSICLGTSLNFINTSSGSSMAFLWIFPDGSTVTSATPPPFTFHTAGLQPVKLVATSPGGCSDTMVHYVVVNSAIAAFSMSDSVSGCPPFTVNFTNESAAVPGSALTYLWDFGNGVTSTILHPNTIYTAAGTYMPTLIVSSAMGCKDTISHTVVVSASPTAVFDYSSITGCAPQSVCFNISSITNSTSLALDFQDGTTVSAPVPLSDTVICHVFTEGGIFAPILVMSNTGTGCVSVIHDPDTIKIGEPVAGFIVTPDPACQFSAVSFSDTSHSLLAGIVSWDWNFDDSASGSANTSTLPNPTHSFEAAGTHNVRLIVADGNGCSDTSFQSVTILPVPVVNVGADQLICAGSVAALHATGAGSYVWGPSAAGLSCYSCADPTATPAATTTYLVTGTDATSTCSAIDSVTVTVVPLPAAPLTASLSYCQYEAAAPLTATPADTAYTLHWYTTPTGGSPLGGPPVPATEVAGTFTWYVSQSTSPEGGLCEGPRAAVTVTVYPQPIVPAAPSPLVYCQDATLPPLTATAGPGYMLLWYDLPAGGTGSTTAPIPSSATPGTTVYYVSQQNSSTGCESPRTPITVSIIPGSAAPVTAGVTYCQFDAASPLTATPDAGLSLQWYSVSTGGTPLPGAPTPSTAIPGTFTWYVSQVNPAASCESERAALTVTVHPKPVVAAGPDQAICQGSTATLTATGATSFVWSPAIACTDESCASGTVAPAVTTTYTVIGESLGCSDTGQVLIAVGAMPAINVTLAADTLCAGESVTLTATGAATYSWTATPGAAAFTGAVVMDAPLTTTTYEVIGAIASGSLTCYDTASVQVVVNPNPVVIVSDPQDICQGGATSLTASGAVTYSWSPGATLSTTSGSHPVATPADTTIYTVIGTDANGCKDTATVTVFTHPLPTIYAGADTSVCPGFSVPLQASPSAGLSFVWLPATGLSNPNIPNPIATPAGPVSYMVTATDSFGCTGTDTVQVSIRPTPEVVVATSADSVCQGMTALLTATGALQYHWLPGGESSSAISVQPSALTTYTVIGTNAGGCKDTATVEVGTYPLLEMTASPDVTICEGASTELSASGAQAYTWSPAATLSSPTGSSTLALPDTTTTYTVIGTDQNGCQDTASILVTVVPVQPTTAGPGGTICKGQEWQLSASGGTAYSWFPATGLSSDTAANPVAAPDVTTTYTVSITQGECLTETHEVTVTVQPTAHVELGNDTSILAGTGIQLTPAYEHVDHFLWTPTESLNCADCAAPYATPAATTTYTVFATNAYGCNDTDAITITVSCDGSQLWVPNTFSPNADGNNDRFYARGNGVSRIESFRVFNRWGEVVYEARDIPTDDINFSWDGTYKGKLLSPDVFVYLIQATCGKGETITLKGDINLIR